LATLLKASSTDLPAGWQVFTDCTDRYKGTDKSVHGLPLTHFCFSLAMSQNVLTFFILLAFLFPVIPASASDPGNFLHEQFDDLSNWKPLHFPKIKKYSHYSIEKKDGRSYLKAESKASASGISFKKEFNIYKYPNVRWMWKISNVYKKGNARKKSGDDYPLRIYFVFKYNPEKASLGQRIIYGLAKKIYGEYPPHSGLNFIWANRQHDESIFTSTYTKEERMVILQSGLNNSGKWMEQEVNIIEDYRKAFGFDPPPVASIVIMNDSDDTGESSVSYIDYIEVYR